MNSENIIMAVRKAYQVNTVHRSSEALIQALKQIGFYRISESIPELLDLACMMTEQAGLQLPPCFEALPSYIPSSSFKKSSDLQLLIDIGGTSTKAGVKNLSSNESWCLLFDRNNNEFQTDDDSSNSLLSYAKVLGKNISQALKASGVNPSTCKQLGLVWSNAMENRPWKLGTGVTGLIVQREKYKKAEWFIKDLKNGDDLGTIITRGFNESGLEFERLIVANDTCLTMKVVSKADAGMVASTGLNATVLKSIAELKLGDTQERVICNGEMGGRFYLADKYLSSADYVNSKVRANTVELLSAGKFLPRLFTNYIIVLGKNLLPELGPLAKSLIQQGEKSFEEFRSKDMTLLFSDYETFIERRSNRSYYTEEVLSVLEELSRALYLRSAELCSVVAYAAIANQITEKEEFTIALDSRLGREVPVFWEAFQTSVQNLMPAGKSLNLILVEPLELNNGKISVPMLGAANALDSF